MIEREAAYSLFNRMIASAEQTLVDFTLHAPLTQQEKANRTLVTGCDKAVDDNLTGMAKAEGFQVISEEGAQALEVARTGNYLTIDPIDGTLGYLEYVNEALKDGNLQDFLKKDRGAASDFCLLLGIVEGGLPRYGACYNYVTKEKILIDGNDRNGLIRENNVRGYTQRYAVYVDQRPGDSVEDKLKAMPDVDVITQAALGLKSLYTVLNPHQAAVTAHRVQEAGLWDILPAAVAARAFGGQVYDDNGEELQLDKYVVLPGKGATIIRGDKFYFVLQELKQHPQNEN